MYIDVLPLSDTTARLVRAYGEAPCIALPSVLPAPEGGSWAVTELGDYCFSESPRNLTHPEPCPPRPRSAATQWGKTAAPS